CEAGCPARRVGCATRSCQGWNVADAGPRAFVQTHSPAFACAESANRGGNQFAGKGASARCVTARNTGQSPVYSGETPALAGAGIPNRNGGREQLPDSADFAAQRGIAHSE